jgi:hypothetical protein
VPWPLSEATPALFFTAIRTWYFFRPSPFIRGCFATTLSSVFESPCLAGLPPAPRYLCAACTCGQAISTVLVGEDGGSPAKECPQRGEFEPCFECEELECIDKRDGAPV